MVNEFEERMRRARLVAQIALMLGLGFSVTVLMRSARFRQEATLLAKGVGRVTAGVGLKVGALEVRVVNRIVKTAGFGVISTRNLAIDAAEATVKDIRKGGGKKTIRKIKFVGGLTVGASAVISAIQEEERSEGDVPQIIAAAAVDITAGTLTFGLAPRGVSGLVRDPETDTLIFVGPPTTPGLSGQAKGAQFVGSFLNKANVTDLVAEAIRLLVTG